MDKCVMCSSASNDPINLGDKITINNLSAHYFCLLLSANLVQNGSDSDGIGGFITTDIEYEVKRASKLVSTFFCGQIKINVKKSFVFRKVIF